MTQATSVRSREASDLSKLAKAHRTMLTLRQTLALLPSAHQSPGLLRDLNRLELRILNLYRLIPDERLSRSNLRPHPFRELVLRDRSSSL
jgi:hypothetical protein